MNRETWLRAAASHIVPLFEEQSLKVPDLDVSCGWPSRGGLPGKNGVRVIGQCWSATTKKGRPQIFISPMLEKSPQVLETLVHEMLHAAVGCEVGHKAAFARPARALGLEGKPTATHAGTELTATLSAIGATVGPYPHKALKIEGDPSTKQTTRMLKVHCLACGYVVRTTQKWLDVGLPTCPCGHEMEIPA